MAGAHRYRGLYLFLMLAGMVLSFGKWVIFSGVLPPAEFGIYTTIITTIAFLSYFGVFGLNEYLIKEGATLAGKSEFSQIFKIRDDIFFVGLLNWVLLVVLVLLVLYFFNGWQFSYFQYILLCGILLVTVIFNIADASLRAALRSLPFAVMVFVRTALLLVIGYLIADRHGLSGILFAEFFSGAIGIIYAFYIAGPRPVISFRGLSRCTISDYFSRGSIFLGLQAFRYISFAADKWIVGWFLGSIALGLYSFLMITFLALTALAGVYNAVFIPRMISLFGKSANLSDLYLKTSRQALFFFAVALLLTPLYLFVANLVVDAYFKNYYFDDLILSIALIYIGSIFHISINFFDSFFYSLSRQFELSIISGISLIVFFVLYFSVGLYFHSVLYFCVAFFSAKLFLFVVTFARVYIAYRGLSAKTGI